MKPEAQIDFGVTEQSKMDMNRGKESEPNLSPIYLHCPVSHYDSRLDIVILNSKHSQIALIYLPVPAHHYSF